MVAASCNQSITPWSKRASSTFNFSGFYTKCTSNYSIPTLGSPIYSMDLNHCIMLSVCRKCRPLLCSKDKKKIKQNCLLVSTVYNFSSVCTITDRIKNNFQIKMERKWHINALYLASKICLHISNRYL